MITLILVISLCVNVFLIFSYNKKTQSEDSSNNNSKVSSICNDDDISKVNNILEKAKYEEIREMIVDIQNIKDHDNDINCNQAIYKLATFAGEKDIKKEYGEKLIKQINNGIGLSAKFDFVYTLQTIKEELNEVN